MIWVGWRWKTKHYSDDRHVNTPMSFPSDQQRRTTRRDGSSFYGRMKREELRVVVKWRNDFDASDLDLIPPAVVPWRPPAADLVPPAVVRGPSPWYTNLVPPAEVLGPSAGYISGVATRCANMEPQVGLINLMKGLLEMSWKLWHRRIIDELLWIMLWSSKSVFISKERDVEFIVDQNFCHRR